MKRLPVSAAQKKGEWLLAVARTRPVLWGELLGL